MILTTAGPGPAVLQPGPGLYHATLSATPSTGSLRASRTVGSPPSVPHNLPTAGTYTSLVGAQSPVSFRAAGTFGALGGSPSAGSLRAGGTFAAGLGNSPSVGSLRASGNFTGGSLGASPSGSSLRGTMGQSASKASLFSVASDTGPGAVMAPPKSVQGPGHQVAAQNVPAREGTGSSAWIIEQVIDFGVPEECSNEAEEVEVNKDCQGFCTPYTAGFFGTCAALRVN